MIVNRHQLLVARPIKDMVSQKRTKHGVSYGLSEAGYDIRIAQTVVFHRASDNNWVGLRGNDDEGELFPGRFALASAMEEFQMPADLVGVVHDKSTWARQGLSVFNTVIEPGWRGFLTLELVYHGQVTLTIPAGSGIAQVLFSQVTIPNIYGGKYQDQVAGPVPAILETEEGLL